MYQRDPDGGRLRGELRDYYGTAMFNGFPMAMMELEEVERASYDELCQMSSQAGITPALRPAASARSSRDSGAGSLRVSASVHAEYVSPQVTGFFDHAPAAHDEGFFAAYGRRLRDAVLRDASRDAGDAQVDA